MESRNFFEEVVRKQLLKNIHDMLWYAVPKCAGGKLQKLKTFGIIIAHSLLLQGPYFNFLAPWVAEILLNENGVSRDISLTF